MTLKQSILLGTSQCLAAAFVGFHVQGYNNDSCKSIRIDREGEQGIHFYFLQHHIAAAVIFQFGANFNLQA